MTTNKTIKFFISSTFIDFIKERNALQNFVFPRLKKLCQKENFYFQPVDLRWGVTEESSEDNKTMEYCLNEVKRCSTDPKPNLLILFGQRYGWGPLPSYLTVDEYNVIIEYFSNPVSRRGLYLKYYHPSVRMLNKWYNQDKNDKKEKYFLKDKKGLDRKEWESIEKELKEIIQIATQENKEYSRFHTSATEQEIRDAIEEQYRADSKNTIVYYRTFREGNDKDLIEGSKEVQQKLFNLKKFLESSKIASVDNPEINVKTYNEFKDEYHPIDKESYEYPKDMPNYLQQFCESIYKEFESKILEEIDSFNKELPSPLKIDLEEQTRFLKSKYLYDDEKDKVIVDVVGRDDEVYNIVNFVKESDEQFYVLYGKSGSGKTSVMAKAISDLQKEKENILYRFIGTTAHTTSPRNTYEFIYWQITDPEATKKPHYMESDDQKFYLQFQKALEDYSKGEKLTLFIDAVDQFNGYDSLEIFLTYVPQNVKVVFSVLYDEEKIDNEDYVTYYKRLEHIPSHKKLEPLSQSSNIEILKNWLENDGRTLLINKENNQQALVEQFIANKTPLYLRLVYEIVREWKSTDHIVKLENKLANTEEGLIVKFFDNVINKHYVKKELLELTLGLISASKYGLSESELIDVLSNEKDILSLYEREGSSYPILEKLPDSIFSKMYYHIQDIFTEKLIDDEMLINPYHRIIGEVIRKEYYEKNSNEFHSKLADYFYTLQDTTKTWDKRYYNLHMLDEYPYQLFYSKNAKELKEILFDLEFAGSVYDHHKQVGFREIMGKVLELGDITEEEVYPWESFYREKEHLITKIDDEMWRPHQTLFQLTYEDGLNSPLTNVSMQILKEAKINFSWMKNNNVPKIFSRNDSIIVKSPHDDYVLWVTKLNINNNVLSFGADFNLYLHDKDGLLLKKIKFEEVFYEDNQRNVSNLINEIIIKEFKSGYFTVQKSLNKEFEYYLKKNKFFDNFEVKNTLWNLARKYISEIPEHQIELMCLPEIFEEVVIEQKSMEDFFNATKGVKEVFDYLFNDLEKDTEYPTYIYDQNGNFITRVWDDVNDIFHIEDGFFLINNEFIINISDEYEERYEFEDENELDSDERFKIHKTIGKKERLNKLERKRSIELKNKYFLYGNEYGELHWSKNITETIFSNDLNILEQLLYRNLVEDNYTLERIGFLDFGSFENIEKNKIELGLSTINQKSQDITLPVENLSSNKEDNKPFGDDIEDDYSEEYCNYLFGELDNEDAKYQHMCKINDGIAFYNPVDNEDFENWKQMGTKDFDTDIKILKKNKEITINVKKQILKFFTLNNTVIIELKGYSTDFYFLDTDQIDSYIYLRNSYDNLKGINYISTIDKIRKFDTNSYAVYSKNSVCILDSTLGILFFHEKDCDEILNIYTYSNSQYLTVSDNSKISLWDKHCVKHNSAYIVGRNLPTQYSFM